MRQNPLNAVHFNSKTDSNSFANGKRRLFVRAFTQNLAWEETDFWAGQFIKDLLGEDDVGISYAAKERLIAHAFTNNTVSDLEMVNIQSRRAVESTEIRSIVETLASPKVIQNHMKSLLSYIQIIYPFPNDHKERYLYLEGTDGGFTTLECHHPNHSRTFDAPWTNHR